MNVELADSLGLASMLVGTLGALDFPSSSSSSGSPGASGSSIAGLLGSDQLSKFGSVTIDDGSQRLTLTSR